MAIAIAIWFTLVVMASNGFAQFLGGYGGGFGGYGGSYGGGYGGNFGYGGYGGGFGGAGCGGGVAYQGQSCGQGCPCGGGSQCVQTVCVVLPPPPPPPPQLMPIQMNIPMTVYVQLGNQCGPQIQCVQTSVCVQNTCQCGSGWYQQGGQCRRRKAQKPIISLIAIKSDDKKA